MSLIPAVAASLVLIAFIAFCVYYLRPAWRIQRQLQEADAALQRLDAPPKLNTLAALFPQAPLSAAWREYQDTLHQRHAWHDGLWQAQEIRATAPAAVYFTAQSVIDSPTRAEFFRHLPGILTGVGIIGTFAGLLQGLYGFTPAAEPAAVRHSLTLLLAGVQEAFIASALAIATAMLMTFLEKFSASRAYAALEQLCQRLDSLFPSGVEEHYLAELLKSSEQNADRLGIALATSLRQPLEQLAQTVERVNEQQARAVENMVHSVLTEFSDRFESSFGERIRSLLGETTATLQTQNEVTGQLARALADASERGEAAGLALEHASGQFSLHAVAATHTLKEAAELVASVSREHGVAAKELRLTSSQLKGVADSLVQTSSSQVAIARAFDGNLHTLDNSTAALRQVLDTENQLRDRLTLQLEKTASSVENFRQVAHFQTRELQSQMQEGLSEYSQIVKQSLDRARSAYKKSLEEAVEAIQEAAEDISQASQANSKPRR